MASNSDSSGKGPARPGSEPPKKPTAVIDLRASQVEVRDPKAAATVADAAAKAAAGTEKGASPAKEAAPPGTGQPAKPASAGPAASSTAMGARAQAPQVTQVVQPTSGGLRGAATHLAAGLAGGLLALFGAESLLPSLPHQAQQQAALPQDLDKRLRNLEQLAARPVPTELAQRLAAAETRLGDFDRSARSITEQQTRLASETQALAARLTESRPADAADERLAKLEEMLTTLSAAAANDPQRGRIPQLAAITGKLADLEASLAAQVGQLRKGVTAEVDSRLSQSTEAAQTARAGVQRIDRDLAGVKTEAAQISQRIDGLKTQGDRLEIGLQGVREETATLKGDLARELRQVARSADVSTAISPLTSKLSALEQNVQGVVRSEDDRRANVERIVTALELGNLKRTIERGAAFSTELAEVRRVAGPKVDLGVLERYKDRGVPALGELEREFRTLAFSIIDADRQPANAHWTDRLMASARSVVRVRKVDQGADDKGIEAQVLKMETSLKGGRLAEVMNEADTLSEKARAPARSWLEKVAARAAVERAITVIEQELKASLGAQSQAGRKG